MKRKPRQGWEEMIVREIKEGGQPERLMPDFFEDENDFFDYSNDDFVKIIIPRKQ